MMTFDEVKEAVERQVDAALDQHAEFVALREVGAEPKQDAHFIMRLFEIFPDETPEAGAKTVIVRGRRWCVSVTAGWLRLDPDKRPRPQKKMTQEEYKQWWAAELARRGIAMKVPDAQLPPARPSPFIEVED